MAKYRYRRLAWLSPANAAFRFSSVFEPFKEAILPSMLCAARCSSGIAPVNTPRLSPDGKPPQPRPHRRLTYRHRSTRSQTLIRTILNLDAGFGAAPHPDNDINSADFGARGGLRQIADHDRLARNVLQHAARFAEEMVMIVSIRIEV